MTLAVRNFGYLYTHGQRSNSSTMPCLTCKKTILANELLCCKDCKTQFHYQCLDISKVQYKELSDTDKKIWQCQGCRNVSRRNRNDDTPIGKKQAQNHQVSADSCETHHLTKEDVREVLRSVLNEEMAKMKSVLTSVIESKIKTVMEEVVALKTSMDFINKEFEDIRSTFKSSNTLAKQLEKENCALRSEIADLGMRMNQMEQHSRANNLEIQCVPEFKDENLISTVLQLGRVVEASIHEDDILHCSRIAKMKNSSSRPRSIVVQFARPKARDGLLASSLQYNKTHPNEKLNSGHLGIAGEKMPVYVVEHLSSTNKALHAAARAKTRELQYKFVWVKHGRVLVRKNESSEHIIIRNMECLNNLK